MLATMGSVVFIYNTMAAEDSAGFFLALATTQLIAVIARFGQEQINTREFLLDKEQAGIRYVVSLISGLFFSLTCVVVVYFVFSVEWLNIASSIDPKQAAALYWFWVLGSVVPQITGAVFRGMRRIGMSEFLSTGSIPGMNLMLLIFFRPEDFASLLSCYALGGLAGSLISLFLAVRNHLFYAASRLARGFDIGGHFAEGARIVIVSLMTTLVTQMPIFLASYLGTDKELSDFGLVYRFTPFLALPLSIAAIVVSGRAPVVISGGPEILRSFNHDISKIIRVACVAYSLSIATACRFSPVSLIQPVIPEFSESMLESVLLMAGASLIAFTFGPASQLLVSVRETTLVLWANFACAAFCFILYSLSAFFIRATDVAYVWSFVTIFQAAIWYSLLVRRTPLRASVFKS